MDGGGIYQQGVFSPSGGSQLTGDKLTGNRAAAGGGLYDNASFATFTGSTISGNRATASGWASRTSRAGTTSAR